MLTDPTKPFVLHPLPTNASPDISKLSGLFALAHAELKNLNRQSGLLTNPMLLLPRILLEDSHVVLDPRGAEKSIDLMQAYRNALLWSYHNLPKLGMGKELLLGSYGQLSGNAGVRRSGVRVHSKEREETLYTAPDPTKIDGYLDEWETFCRTDNKLDPLAKAAISLSRLGAIHPFADGNGRMMRLMFVLSLLNSGLLKHPILGLNDFIRRNRNQYFDILRQTTYLGKYEDIIEFMLYGVIDGSRRSQSIIKSYMAAQQMATQKLDKIDLPAPQRRILSLALDRSPVFTKKYMADKMGCETDRANEVLQLLAERKILSVLEVGEKKLYLNRVVVGTLF